MTNIIRGILLTGIIFSLACEEGGLLIETDISDSNVFLIAPSDGVEISSNTVFFDWEPVEDATSYEIQVATPNFGNTQQLLLNITDSLTFNELTINVGDYEWRVRAKNSNYETQYSTAGFRVIPVDNFSNNVVQLTSPVDNLITNEAQQILVWESVEGATIYRLQIMENGNLRDEQATNGTNLDYTFQEGSFEWQVRAENGTENTLYSSRDILIDMTSPNTPSLSLPENGVTITSQQVSFEWSRELIEGSVEFDSIFVYRDVDLTDLVLKDQVTSPFESTLENNTYYWFVKAFDNAGNDSNDSTVFNFTVNQ